MPVSTLCVTLNHSCLFFTSFKLLLCQSQTRRGQQMVSTFKMQEAALRSGKILLLPMTASLPSALPLFLSYRVCLCSFEDACQNVLQPTIKIWFFSKVTLFFSFSIVKIQLLQLLLAPNPLTFMHALISHIILQGAGAEEMFWCYWFLMCFSTSHSCLLTFWAFAVAQIKFLISSSLLNSLSELRHQETHLPHAHK